MHAWRLQLEFVSRITGQERKSAAFPRAFLPTLHYAGLNLEILRDFLWVGVGYIFGLIIQRMPALMQS